MKYLYIKIAFVSIIFLNSCAINAIDKSRDVEMDSKNISIVLSMILGNANFKKYIHPDVKGRIPLHVVTNGNLMVSSSLEVFGKEVIFYDVSPKNTNIPLIQIELFAIENNEVTFSMSYEIEGIIIKGNVVNKTGNWEFSDFSLIES